MKSLLLALLTDLTIACILELARNTQVTLDPPTLTTRLFCLDIRLSQAGIDLIWYQEQSN